MKSTQEMTHEEILEIVRRLRIGYQLKSIIRYGTSRDMTVHNESVAEHVFALFYLAEFFLPIEDPQQTLDVVKLHRILLFHDFGEILNGDIPSPQKTKAHEEREREDAKQVFASLPESLGDVARKSWHEYEDHMTREALFAYALDKVEPAFELMHPVTEHSIKRLKITLEEHTARKQKATEGFPGIRRFVDVITEDMVQRGVFWDGK